MGRGAGWSSVLIDRHGTKEDNDYYRRMGPTYQPGIPMRRSGLT